ncbi:unnamed protein product [Caenorhabditis angaria]|uniref:Domain of unknown function DX domain-containing protein n=1 Tax=Caenorhabditis angaria TaxID=860376 RepID=A0A9P1ILV7_9PELO|nr:unnamed protein product [Caenorhabditis angaria]
MKFLLLFFLLIIVETIAANNNCNNRDVLEYSDLSDDKCDFRAETPLEAKFYRKFCGRKGYYGYLGKKDIFGKPIERIAQRCFTTEDCEDGTEPMVCVNVECDTRMCFPDPFIAQKTSHSEIICTIWKYTIFVGSAFFVLMLASAIAYSFTMKEENKEENEDEVNMDDVAPNNESDDMNYGSSDENNKDK